MTTVHRRHPEFLADQRQFFDELIVEHWDAYASDQWDMARRYEVAHLFKRETPGRILDVGCGCGFHDLEMANYPFVKQVDAVDYSPRSIERAEEAYPHSKVRRWVADFSDLPDDTRYDMVVSFQVFEHLYNPGDYLESAKRLLTPGGTVAISTPNFARLDNRIRKRRGLDLSFVDPQHFEEYTPGSLSRLAAQYGLKRKSWFGYDISSLMIPQLDRLPYRQRLIVGRLLPNLARVFCMVFEVDDRV
jgi:SAM-dependent methyltransferase